MSYNGIGLQSVRGSGTSGYVQTNLSSKQSSDKNYKHRQSIKKRKQIEQEIEKCNEKRENARNELKKHHRHRHIDVRCMELRDELEDMSEDEAVIVEKVELLRKKLTEQTSGSGDDSGDDSSLETSSRENNEESTTLDKRNKSQRPVKSDNLNKANKLNNPDDLNKLNNSTRSESSNRNNHTTTPNPKKRIQPSQTSPESQVYQYEPRYKRQRPAETTK